MTFFVVSFAVSVGRGSGLCGAREGTLTVKSDPHQPPDGALPAAITLAVLYDRLAGRLLGAARTLGCPAVEAEDIVHDLFVSLARSGTPLEGVVDIEAYAFTGLRHAVARRRQALGLERVAIDRSARQREAEGRLVTPAAQPVDFADQRIERALARLPPAQREVVALKIDGGLSFAQIAVVTGVSINTAAGRYRYALEKLRVLLVVQSSDHSEVAR